jgi:hypothetical protein
MEEERNVYRVLMEKPEEGDHLEWENGIRMDLGEIVLGSVDWIQLAQDRDWWWALVDTVMKVWVLAPQN